MKIVASTTLASLLTYNDWCRICASSETADLSDLVDKFKQVHLAQPLVELVTTFRSQIEELSKKLGVEWSLIAKAFASKPVYALLKAVGFSLKVLVHGITAFTDLYKNGIMRVFIALSRSGIIAKVRKGIIKVDAVLDQYPMLRKIGGPVVVGFLLWAWLHASFTGHPDLDMNLSQLLKEVLVGNWTFEDILLSPAGLLAMTTLFAGLAGFPLITPVWLAGGPLKSLFVALLYTGLRTVYRNIPIKVLAL